MKKMVLALAVLLGSAGMVVAEEGGEAIDNQEVLDSNSGDDGWTGVYGSLGLGWEWFENKGDFVYDSNTNLDDETEKLATGSMDKQKCNRFYGALGLGGQILFAQHFLAGLEFDCYFAKSEDKNAVLKQTDGISYNPTQEEFHVKNKGVSPALYGKVGYVFCNKHAVYAKLGVKWIKTRIEDKNHTTKGDESFDSNKGVFAAALGYQCAFSKNFSGYVEVSYAGRNKADHGAINNAKSISLKTNDSNWGFGAGVSVRFPISQSN